MTVTALPFGRQALRLGLDLPIETAVAQMIGGEFPTLLASAQGGSERAFSTLYRRLNAPLTRYFAAQAGGVAEDLAAETWLSVAKGLRSFSGNEDDFRAWLFTIGRRRLVEHWRTTARRPLGFGWEAEVLAARAAADDTEASGLDGCSAQEAAAMVTRLLPPDQAEVVLLRCLAGLDVAAVATMLDKRPGTVRVLQHKGLRRLAQLMSVEALTG